mgnify:FL=1
MTENPAAALQDPAVRAYIYGFPMIFNLDEIVSITTKPKVAFGAPVRS